MKKTILCLAGLLAASASTQATVTLDFLADRLRTADNTPIPQNALILIVADTSNNGFSQVSNGASLSINSLLGGGDDRIVGRFNLSVWATDGVFQTPPSIFDLDSVTGWNEGDGLALYWFPTLTLASDQAVAGTSYGAFTGPVGSSGESWVTPSNTSSSQYTFFTTTGSDLGPGAFPSSQGQALLTVVPEGSPAVLALAGLLGLCLRRRGSRQLANRS